MKGTDKVISESQFCSTAIEDITIKVIKYNAKYLTYTIYDVDISVNDTKNNITWNYVSHKIYSQFQELYNTLITKYPHINLPEFPSKIKLVNKEESMKYFNTLFKTILSLIKNNQSYQSEILGILYKFSLEDKNIAIMQKNSGNNEDVPSFIPASVSSIASVSIGTIANNISSLQQLIQPKKASQTESQPYLQKKDSINNKLLWHNVYIKREMEKYQPICLKIEEQCLFIYKSISSADFDLIVPLYKINIEIFRSNLKTKKQKFIYSDEIKALRQYGEVELSQLDSEFVIKLFHDFNSYPLYVKFPSQSTIQQLKSFIEALENNSHCGKSQSIYIDEINKTNVNIYGNVSISLKQLTIQGYNGTCMVKVSLSPYSFNTKKMINNTEFDINQTFVFPLHNRFQMLTFEVIKISTERLFNKKGVESKAVAYSIELPELLNTFNVSKDYFTLEIEKDKIQLQLQLINWTSLLALLTKNENENIIEDIILTQKDFKLKIVFKRFKRLTLLIKEFRQFITNIINFKYPSFSFVVMTLLILYCFLCKTQYLPNHILFFIGLILLRYSRLYQLYCAKYINKYLFSRINANCKCSQYITPRIIDEAETIMQSDYLITQQKKKLKIPTFSNLKAYKKSLHNVFIAIVYFTTLVEKIKNLFLWTDPLLSLYFFFLILFMFLIVLRIELRFLLFLTITGKFAKGFLYYKRKLRNNKEIGRIIIEHCLSLHNKGGVNAKGRMIHYCKKGDWAKIDINDNKLKALIIKQLTVHADIQLKASFFNENKKVGDLIKELGKYQELLFIKPDSILFYRTINNLFVYNKPIKPKDLLLYFVQNVKSDYYIAKHGLNKELEKDLKLDQEEEEEEDEDDNDNEEEKNNEKGGDNAIE